MHCRRCARKHRKRKDKKYNPQNHKNSKVPAKITKLPLSNIPHLRRLGVTRDHFSIKAEPDFNIDSATESVLDFVQRLRTAIDSNIALKNNKSIILDLSEVEKISHTTIALVASASFLKRRAHVGVVFISEPKNSVVVDRLRSSGLMELFRFVDFPGDVPMSKNKIIPIHNKKVADPALIDNLMNMAMTTVTGKPLVNPLVAGMFGELTKNSFYHASPKGRGKEMWCISCEYDEPNKTVKFSVIDWGIGISNSIKRKYMVQKPGHAFRMMLNIFDDLTVVRNVLNGKLVSESGAMSRGTGLPFIVNHIVKENYLSNFAVISNAAYVNVSTDISKKLGIPLKGTLLYFEISPDNVK